MIRLKYSMLAACSIFICFISGNEMARAGEADALTSQFPMGVDISISSGKTSGPVVVVISGGRADQQFPLRAVRQLNAWPIAKGKLVSIAIDLPQIPKPMLNYIRAQKPDWILELRENFYHPRKGLKTRGGLVIHKNEDTLCHVSTAMVAAVNKSFKDKNNYFRHAVPTVDDESFAFDAANALDSKSMLIISSARKNSTPTREYRCSERIRQHRLLVYSFLQKLGMVELNSNVDRIISPDKRQAAGTSKKLYVAIYDGQGSGRPMLFVTDLMNEIPYVEAHPLNPVEIRNGALDVFDVILVPGGNASIQYDALGGTGRKAIQKFVKNGGGYVGICAGAFLAASRPYTWGLDLVDAGIVDHDHWARGIGTVKVELTESGRRIFGAYEGQLDLHYANGPIFAPSAQKNIDDYEVLAWFRTGIGKNGADPNVMIDTPAIISGQLGDGRVIVSSGHAEWSTGLEGFLLNYVEWAGGRSKLSKLLRR